jgi:hypothetical protein
MIVELHKRFLENIAKYNELWMNVSDVSRGINRIKSALGIKRSQLIANPLPWIYDPRKPSLINMPWMVLSTYTFAGLDTKDILSLYNTCKTFNVLIGKPSLENHHKWNLSSRVKINLSGGRDNGRSLMWRPLSELLHRGRPVDWIHGISSAYYVSALFPHEKPKCRICYSSDAHCSWEFRVAFCKDCVLIHTIRYLLVSYNKRPRARNRVGNA